MNLSDFLICATALLGEVSQTATDRNAAQALLLNTQDKLTATTTECDIARSALGDTRTPLTVVTADRDDLATRLAAANKAPAPTPTRSPLPAPDAIFKAATSNSYVNLAGTKWLAQTGAADGLLLGSDGASLIARVKAGEHALFDPPRKIRSELGGVRRYAKGEPIRLSGTVKLDAETYVGGTDWNSLIQIHQADVWRSTKSQVGATAMFGVDILPNSAGQMILRVHGETGIGPQPTDFTAPYRLLGTMPFVLGVEHDFVLEVIDGHGENGKVFVSIDNKPVVNFTGPTGFGFVDAYSDVLIGGKPQQTGSYLKLGIYAGKNSGNMPPAGLTERVTYRNLSAP